MICQMIKWLNLNKSAIEQYYSIAFKVQDLYFQILWNWSLAKKVNAEGVEYWKIICEFKFYKYKRNKYFLVY